LFLYIVSKFVLRDNIVIIVYNGEYTGDMLSFGTGNNIFISRIE